MRKIPLTKGKHTIVDDEDFDFLNQWKWTYMESKTVTARAYRKESSVGKDNSKRKNILLHRFIMECPTGFVVDHINGNGLDNRKSNLRVCTHSENLMNRGKTMKNTSGFKGVCWRKKQKKWMAQIRTKNKVTYLGIFEELEDAVKAYNSAALLQHGKFANLNK